MTGRDCWPGEIDSPDLRPRIAQLPFVSDADSWRAFCGDPERGESRIKHMRAVLAGQKPCFFIERDLYVMAGNRWNLPPDLAFSIIGLALECELWSRSMMQRRPQDLEVWPDAPFHRPGPRSAMSGLAYRAGLYGPHVHAWWNPAQLETASGLLH